MSLGNKNKNLSQWLYNLDVTGLWHIDIWRRTAAEMKFMNWITSCAWKDHNLM